MTEQQTKDQPKERDALAAKVASYERADRDLNEALNMGDGSYRP